MTSTCVVGSFGYRLWRNRRRRQPRPGFWSRVWDR